MMGAAGIRRAPIDQMAAIEETSARELNYPAYAGRGDDPPNPPRMGGLRPPITPPREDAAKTGSRFARPRGGRG
jgi:hypothetical protein